MLTTKTLSGPRHDDEDLTRSISNVQNVLQPLLETELLDGVLLTDLTIPAGGKLVAPHGLGRPAQGYMVVFASAAVPVPYALSADQTTPNGAIVLSFSSGTGAKISLWVF